MLKHPIKIEYNSPDNRELPKSEIDYRIAEITKMRADDRNWKYIAKKLHLHRDSLQEFRTKHGLML